MNLVLSEVFLRYRCTRVGGQNVLFAGALCPVVVCVQNLFRPQHWEVVLLVLVCVCVFFGSSAVSAQGLGILALGVGS